MNSQENAKESVDIQEPTIDLNTANYIKDKLEQTDKIMKWVSTILTLALPHETFPKLTTAIKKTSEEILSYRINILQSVDGHIYVTKESFTKKQKNNPKLMAKNGNTNSTQTIPNQDSTLKVTFININGIREKLYEY